MKHTGYLWRKVQLTDTYFDLARRLGLRPDAWIVGSMSLEEIERGIKKMRSMLGDRREKEEP